MFLFLSLYLYINLSIAAPSLYVFMSHRLQVRTDFIEVLDAIDGVRKPKDGGSGGNSGGGSSAGREQNVYRQIFDRLKVPWQKMQS